MIKNTIQYILVPGVHDFGEKGRLFCPPFFKEVLGDLMRLLLLNKVCLGLWSMFNFIKRNMLDAISADFTKVRTINK